MACLYMIIRYYKGFVSISKLEEMLKTTRNGTTAYHIVKVLEELGFNAYGQKNKKLTKTKIPFIAHTLIESSYKHYMVVYEVTDKYVKVADPANRIKKMSHTEFLSIWTGISIEMYPKDIITYEKPKTKIKLFKLDKKIVLIIGFISIVITFLSIITSFFFQILIEKNNIKNVVLFFISLILIRIILNYAREKILIKFTSNIEKNIMEKVFKNIIKLPYRYYHNHTTGELISKINDLTIFKDITLKLILTCFIDLPLTLLSGFMLFYINKKLFIISLLILIFYILIILIYHKKINTNIGRTLEEKTKLNSFMTESINGFETIKGINIENKIIDIFKNKNKNYIKSKIKLNNILNRENTIKDIVSSIGTSLILIVGVIEVKEGGMSLSMLITYNILVSFFEGPIKNIIDLDYEIKEAKSAYNRVINLIEKDKENNLSKVNGNIEISNLKFSIDDINYILKSVNLKIKEKNKVLIAGKSGSGKSTLLKLIKGYYTDYEGKLLIGGKKYNSPSNILYLSNKETLFKGTFKYNLSLRGSNEINKKNKICNVDDIINNYPLKENTLLEEDGFNISNGQKQRIALSRSLHNFDILLIDEGTSALDINLERRILKNLFKEYKDKTIIVVSHRLDNLDLFDQYVKLESGQVILSSSKRGKEA